jgi:hypothetical protein
MLTPGLGVIAVDKHRAVGKHSLGAIQKADRRERREVRRAPARAGGIPGSVIHDFLRGFFRPASVSMRFVDAMGGALRRSGLF